MSAVLEGSPFTLQAVWITVSAAPPLSFWKIKSPQVVKLKGCLTIRDMLYLNTITSNSAPIVEILVFVETKIMFSHK